MMYTNGNMDHYPTQEQPMKLMSIPYQVNLIHSLHIVGMLWGIFTACWTVMNIIVFIEPQWLGDTDTSPGVGYFGLYQYCELFNSGQTIHCGGQFESFPSILSDAFKAAAFLVGFSALMFLLCVCCFLLFFFTHPSNVYYTCASLQLVGAVCITVGCIIYPAGWDKPQIAQICGYEAGRYNRAHCDIRWAYILAIIGIFLSIALCVLGYLLAVRHPKRSKDEKNDYGTLQTQVLNDSAW